MSDKNKSILLQVALKAAVDTNPTAVETLTEKYYDLLVNLHSKYGISLEYDDKKQYPPKAKAEAKPEEDVPTVIVNGTLFRDYRNSDRKKANPKFPDFKSVDNKQSIWLNDREGNPSDEGIKFLEAVAG